MQHLPIFINITSKPVLVVGDGETAEAKSRLIKLAGGEPQRCECGSPAASATCDRNYSLAFVAVDDPTLAASWATALRAKGLLVNVADLPTLCDFILPSIVDREPVLVAISTGGVSATVAKRLREAIEGLLPAKLGEVVQAIGNARAEVAKRLTTTGGRRRFWDAMLRPGGRFDPLVLAEPPTLAELIRVADTLPQPQRCITHIQPRSPDPDDLSLKMLRRLQAADVIVSVGDGMTGIAERGRRDAQVMNCDITELTETLDALKRDANTFQIVVIAKNDSAQASAAGWTFEIIG